MHNVRLIYSSCVSKQFESADIERILMSARRNNQKLGVCGMLCFTGDQYFFQCLEGEQKAVDQLYQIILNDVRHEDTRLIDYRDIDEALFAEWDMGYFPASLLNDPEIKAHWQGNHFRPDLLTAEQANELILLLRQRIPKP